MENNQLEFITKIHTQGKTKRPIIRKITKLILFIYILIFLFIIWMDGFSLSIFRGNILPLLLLFYVLNQTKPTNTYKNTVVKVQFDDECINIIYDGLDRNDNMGPRIEQTSISYVNITKLEYSKALSCLNIQGYPIERVKYIKQSGNNEFINDFIKKKNEKRTLLYVTGKENQIIVQKLEEKTNMSVTYLN